MTIPGLRYHHRLVARVGVARCNGAEHRHRANCCWPVNDTVVVGDWQNGNLYALDNRVFTDDRQPIKRVRSFPHMLADGKRVFYRQFLADVECGNPGDTTLGAPEVRWCARLVQRICESPARSCSGRMTLLAFSQTT